MNKGDTVIYYPNGEPTSSLSIGEKYIIEELSNSINYKSDGIWNGLTYYSIYVNNHLMITLESSEFMSIEQYRIVQIENIINDI